MRRVSLVFGLKKDLLGECVCEWVLVENTGGKEFGILLFKNFIAEK